MLWIILFISIVLIIVGYINDETCVESFGWVFSVISFLSLLLAFGCYNETKTTANKQVALLEERNKEVIEQIEPFVDKYINYEKETLNELRITSDNIVALSAYPEIKGNDFVMKQIDVVLENQKKITKLKLDLIGLDAYKLWLFMGKD